ncbi:MAG TPA: hypothetical protein VGV37_06055 [Aliidongia sp.]|uniref:hypothetical protein n=1 Tax=Aliidongia sp. TaxID=1914230 RepID=UPI002DDCD90C|nr:hypothetical protein [Aliidongia sp.]HEV2674087.1 hypothetical protein [Aliidongia sp.]
MIPTSLRRVWGQGAATAPVALDPRSAPMPADTDPTPAKWETDVLFVCLRCSTKLPDGLAPDGRTTLRQWFKDRLGSVGRGKALRVVETSCLGLCPEQRIAVAIGRELAADPAIIRSVATEADREAIYRMAVGDQPGPKL